MKLNPKKATCDQVGHKLKGIKEETTYVASSFLCLKYSFVLIDFLISIE